MAGEGGGFDWGSLLGLNLHGLFGGSGGQRKALKRLHFYERHAEIAATHQGVLQRFTTPYDVASAGRIYALPGPTTFPSGGSAYPQPQPQPQQPPTPQTWDERLLQDVGLAAQVAQQILAWLQGRQGAVGFPGFNVGTSPAPTSDVAVATYSGGVMPSIPTGSIWGTLGSALGQLGAGALQSISTGGGFGGGYGPIAMPGGAPIMGITGGGVGPLSIPNAPTRMMGARQPSIVVVGGRAYRSLGTPIAWSGDITAVRRLRRAAHRISKVIPHHRTSRRFR